MEYSSELPTTEGFYWFRNNYYMPTVVRICYFSTYNSLRQIFLSDSISKSIGSFVETDAEWAGPIEEPLTS